MKTWNLDITNKACPYSQGGFGCSGTRGRERISWCDHPEIEEAPECSYDICPIKQKEN